MAENQIPNLGILPGIKDAVARHCRGLVIHLSVEKP
jgi:hypothetical protein